MNFNLYHTKYCFKLLKIKHCFLGALLLALPGFLLAQAPNISYPISQIIPVGKAITPIVPTNTGGAVPASAFGQVTTFAGKGRAANGIGENATFNGLAGLVTDANGNVYVADVNNNLIRKIDPAGVVTTFAGSGLNGFYNGTGTNATFSSPNGLAIDAQGNLYVADKNNMVIRKITPAGVVTTFAGNGQIGKTNGPGNLASFNYPTNLAIDAKGNLYVTDTYNQLIRKITPSGIVSTFAGSGNYGAADGKDILASFSSPQGLTTDAKGNVYVADGGNSLIRKIDSLGNVTTIAGNNNQGYIDGNGTSASFSHPTGITIDASGNLYVADLLNNRIRKIDKAGLVTTFAGTGGDPNNTYAGNDFFSPYGIAIDASGNLYVSDQGNGRIRKISPTAQISTLAGSKNGYNTNGKGIAASFNYPCQLANDTKGNIYVADAGNNLIRKIDPDGVVTTFAGSGAQGSANGVGTAASFFSPKGIAVDAAGNIYVSEVGNKLIRKIDPNGSVTTLAGSGKSGNDDGIGTAASFKVPTAMAVDQNGNVYVVDYFGNNIRKIDPTGNVTTFAGSGDYADVDGKGTAASFRAPQSIVIDAKGNIYIGEFNKIRKIDPSGLVTTFVNNFPLGTKFKVGGDANIIVGLCLDKAGNIYATDNGTNTIRKIEPSGNSIEIAGEEIQGFVNGTGALAGFNDPHGITIDVQGNIYIADSGNDLIRKISTTGYAINPQLPDGLSFDATTGTITGTPKATIGATAYTITAYNSEGSSRATLNLSTGRFIKSSIPENGVAGSTITILGAGFTGATGVKFGDKVSPNFKVINDTLIIATSVQTPLRNGYMIMVNSPDSIIKSNSYFFATYAPDFSFNPKTQFITINTPINLDPYNAGGYTDYSDYGSIYTYVGTGNAGALDGNYNNATFNYPQGIVSDIYNNLYIADSKNNKIRKVNLHYPNTVTTFAGTGSSITVDGAASSAGFSNPVGLAIDFPGNVYVTETQSNLIRKISAAGLVTTIAGNGQTGAINANGKQASFNQPFGIAVDLSGTIYVADAGNNQIRKISTSGDVTTLAGSSSAGLNNGNGASASFNQPLGVAVDGSGNVFVTDSRNNLIRKIAPDGTVTTFAGSGLAGSADGNGTSASFNGPSGITIDLNGDLYITDSGSNLIRKISPAGIVTTLAGNNYNGNTTYLASLAGITVNNFGYLFAADVVQNKIFEVTSSGFTISPTLPTGLQLFYGTIHGTPTVTSPNTTYTIKGYNAAGSGTATLNLAVTPVFMIPPDNYHLKITGETCLGTSNGSIGIKVDATFDYTAVLTGTGVNLTQSFTDTTTFTNLPAGSYTLTFTIDGKANYSNKYSVTITQPQALSVYATVNEAAGNIILNLSGGSIYHIQLNDKTYTTTASNFTVPLALGNNALQVTTDRECQGIFTKLINPSFNISPYPMPFESTLNLNLGSSNIATVSVRIYSANTGLQVFTGDYQNQSGVLQLDLSKLAKGAYGMQLIINNNKKEFKIIK